MSTQAKILCHSCNNHFYIYHGIGYNQEQSKHCPHCGAVISDFAWEGIWNTLLSAHDVNCHFLKHHIETKENLFSLEVEFFQTPEEENLHK